MSPRHASLVVTAALAALCLFGIPAKSFASVVAHLTLQSEPGDYIGQGGSYDIRYRSPGPSSFSAQILKYLPDGRPAQVHFGFWNDDDLSNTFALLYFGTDQLGIPIQPGTYPDARRMNWGLPGHPEMWIHFQHRSGEPVEGSFTVTEATFFKQNRVTEIGSFAATFEQRVSQSPATLRGTFTYRNLDAPTAIPEPGSLALLGSAVVGVLMSRRRR